MGYLIALVVIALLFYFFNKVYKFPSTWLTWHGKAIALWIIDAFLVIVAAMCLVQAFGIGR